MMDKFLYTEINVVGIIILIILLFNRCKDIGSTLQQRLFDSVMYLTIAILIFDAGMWLLDGVEFPHAREMTLAVTRVYFLLNGLIPYCWYLYAEFSIHNDVKRLRWVTTLSAIPLALFFVFIFINMGERGIFYFDSNNFYHRGSYSFIPLLLAAVYLSISSMKAIRHARQACEMMEKQQYYYMASFIIFPLASAVIQMLFFGVSIIWISIVISQLIVFINIQNRQITTDSLTGLNNRSELFKFLGALLKNGETKNYMALMIADIDKFKEINDRYGHTEGDRALVTVATVLKSSCRHKKAFISRYGGDEFVLICQSEDRRDFAVLREEIHKNLLNHNMKKQDPYALTVSIGYAVWDQTKIHSDEELFNMADENMYQEKQTKQLRAADEKREERTAIST